MSTTTARIIAAPLALLAFGLHLLVTFLIEPLGFGHSFGAFMLITMGATILTLLIIAAVWFAVGRAVLRRNADLRVDAARGRFSVPAQPIVAGSLAVFLMWAAAGEVMTERVPNEPGVRPNGAVPWPAGRARPSRPSSQPA